MADRLFQMTENMELKEHPEKIPEYYGGKIIFITGFSGFMGKVLVEKLLRSCPEIKRIYVLMREKKGLPVQKRMEEIFSLPLFEKILESDLRKVVAVEGDACKEMLGLSESDLTSIYEEVSVVFHASASVRFDDPLVTAVDANIRSTKSVVEICTRMKNLNCLVQISTAYANCDRKIIKEELYPPHADWKVTLELTSKIDPLYISILTQKYTNGMPNTYVFTKSLAEHVVAEYSDRVPSIIFRPSIVVSTIDEPIPGWIDNMNGPAGLLAGYGTGVIRTSICNDSISPDYMPVDIAIRALVAAPWAVNNIRERQNLTVLNCCSSDRSISTREMVKIGCIAKDKYPMKMMIWKPGNHISTSKFWFIINVYMFHLLPAAFLDSVLRIIGKKPILWKLQRKVFIAMTSLLHFTLNQFDFDNSRILKLNDLIMKEDQKDFLFNRQSFDPLSYFERCTIGFQKYVLKQQEWERPQAARNLKIFTALDFLCKAIAVVIVVWYAVFISSIPQNIWKSISQVQIPFLMGLSTKVMT